MSNNNWKQMRRLMWVQTILLALILLCGCAETLTKEEIEWRRGIDRENWALCQRVYKQAGEYLVFDHAHNDNEKTALLRSDLARNNCRMVLRDYWIKY